MTDRGLEPLLRAKKLRSLELGGAQFTDDGLRRLAEAFPGLVQLGFDAGRCTADGMDHLRKLSKLNTLTLQHAKHIDPAAFARLKKAIPILTVFVEDAETAETPRPGNETAKTPKLNRLARLPTTLPRNSTLSRGTFS